MDLQKIIDNRRIIIWGTGKTGKSFYNRNKGKIDFYACTSSESEIIPIENLPTISYKEVNKENDYLIISSIYYDEIRRTLILNNYEQFKDFMFYDTFEKLWEAGKSQKNLLIGVGQCEIEEICSALNGNELFRKNYVAIYFDERKVCMHGANFCLEEYKECQMLLGQADYFIMPSCLAFVTKNSYEHLKKQLSTKAKVKVVSLIEFDSYWAQDISLKREMTKYYMVRATMEEKGIKISAYANRDRIIERFVDEGYSIKEIMGKIKDNNLFEVKDVLDNHRKSIRRAILMDRISDISIADYIEKEYTFNKLFCDRGHFNEYVLAEYTRRILYDLGIDTIILPSELQPLFASVNELPVYPSTANILGLEWWSESSTYRMHCYNGVKFATFDEYMEHMIRYYKGAKKVLKECYL